MRAAFIVLPLLALAACQSSNSSSMGATRDMPPSQVRTVQLLGPNGELRGTASLEARPAGLRIAARVEGLAPGTYAIHYHRIGLCTAPTFDSAGPHFNPLTKQHGTENPMGPHMGDLPNIIVGASGKGEITHTVDGLMLTGGPNALLDADGAAVVLHAGPDDYKTDPSGNSGKRIACATLGA
ncbi:superoxide dismutase family protein [Glacieibacterium frigidum]|uniref:Superoxide dismutase family protein n=1 Tax=Glacieibacterium frigidum TaxID=2593303 RepID=A0A552UHD3_9SPHN|nr:superoxide dismutase family protein [Glacieibacterium frigidum]TRW17622.1 superoxide dismutase family protein [Glacieibacterium frigidum]